MKLTEIITCMLLSCMLLLQWSSNTKQKNEMDQQARLESAITQLADSMPASSEYRVNNEPQYTNVSLQTPSWQQSEDLLELEERVTALESKVADCCDAQTKLSADFNSDNSGSQSQDIVVAPEPYQQSYASSGNQISYLPVSSVTRQWSTPVATRYVSRANQAVSYGSNGGASAPMQYQAPVAFVSSRTAVRSSSGGLLSRLRSRPVASSCYVDANGNRICN